MKLSRIQVCGLLVVLFHVVGFIGFNSSEHFSLFKKLVPFHLLLMAGLLIYSARHKNAEFWKFILLTYIAGFVIELLGVHTGVIFGEYSYGSTLGLKVAEIPLLIGVNWVIMIYSAGIFVREFPINNRAARSALGAFLVTLVDFLIEPVAIRQDYWSWTKFDIPVRNYVSWYIFSFIMLSLFYSMRFSKRNPVASILFVVQLLFFLVLNFTAF